MVFAWMLSLCERIQGSAPLGGTFGSGAGDRYLRISTRPTINRMPRASSVPRPIASMSGSLPPSRVPNGEVVCVTTTGAPVGLGAGVGTAAGMAAGTGTSVGVAASTAGGGEMDVGVGGGGTGVGVGLGLAVVLALTVKVLEVACCPLPYVTMTTTELSGCVGTT